MPCFSISATRSQCRLRSELDDRPAQLLDVRWFTQQAIHVQWEFARCAAALAPAGDQHDGCDGRRGLYRRCDLTSVHVGHSYIGENESERLAALSCSDTRVTTRLAAVRHSHSMAVSLEDPAQRFRDARVVVYHEDTQALRRRRWCGVLSGRCGRGRGDRKNQTDGAAFVWLALYLNLGAVPLDHSVHHGESQPGASLALGGIERLKTLAPRLFRHSNAGVADIHAHTRERPNLGGLSRSLMFLGFVQFDGTLCHRGR